MASQDGINQGLVLVLLVQTTNVLILIILDTFIEVIFPKKNYLYFMLLYNFMTDEL